MDSNSEMSRILNNPVACPACGQENEPRASRCSACQAVIAPEEEEAPLSFLSAAEGAGVATFRSGAPKIKTPVEEAKNYLLMKSAAAGIQDGSMNIEEYKKIILRLLGLSFAGLKVFESDVMKKKFENESDEAKASKVAMNAAFQVLYEGLAQMESYSRTNNLQDVKQGAEVAEKGFYAISRAQDLALALDD